jgi:hypothetical protein
MNTKMVSLSVLLLASFPPITMAQQGEWETVFQFGNDQVLGTDGIEAVHMVHVYDALRASAGRLSSLGNPQVVRGEGVLGLRTRRSSGHSQPWERLARPVVFSRFRGATPTCSARATARWLMGAS